MLFQKIEKIIERDFFPDLPKLSIQKSYFDALEQNDLVKLRELQMKYGGACPTTGRLSTVCKTTFFLSQSQNLILMYHLLITIKVLFK